MSGARWLAVSGLLLLSACRAPTAKEVRDARDEVTNDAMEVARQGCIAALADPDAQWESPETMDLCMALATGRCPK